jgi:methyl-accepting chemotaxis protein
MSARSVFKKFRERRPSMRAKLILSLSSIAAIMLLSSLISVMEYTSMSNYVSDLIADDIRSINVANRLADMSNTYNLQILEVVGEETSLRVPDFDDGYFKSHCDSLRLNVATNQVRPLADSVMYSYSAYMLTSLELEDVMQSDFIDSRSWYFERLQPRFERLRTDLEQLSLSIHKDLERNSVTFEHGFYRSIIPGVVAIGVGLLLVLMLLFFLLALYVNPLYRMLDGLNAYRSQDKKYTVKFDGDDELVQLNEGISELVNENRQFRSRIKTVGKK